MQALRYPFAVGWGGLITLALFYSLWRMISGPVEVTVLKPTPFPRFTPTHIDTPIQTKHPQRPERTPPKVDPALPPIDTQGPTDVRVPLQPQRVIDTGTIGSGGGVSVGTDQDAVPLVRIDPTYPPRAEIQGIEGWVKVQFSITPTGMVTDLEIIDSAPKGVFEKSTLDAVRRWRYSPRVVNGAAVERVGVQTVVTFRLNGK